MEVIITSQHGILISDIEKELRSGTLLGRSVLITDSLPLSDRNIQADLLDVGELFALRSDPRILQVERLHEMAERTIPVPDAVQPINPIYQDVLNNSHDNWGLDYCTEDTGSTFTYSHTGKDVDVVIMDSGIHATHTEFMDMTNTFSRVQQIEWKTGQNTDRPEHYTDTDGHGTHVAATVAGRTQGWAREANIYAMKIFDSGAYGVLEALQLIRNWHNTKMSNNPTVVNMSWGYSTDYPANYPDAQLAGTPHPVRVASVDAELESMIDDGIIIVSSAGNSDAYMPSPELPAYSEYYYTDADYNYLPSITGASYMYYYRRKTPAGANGVICVGSNGDISTLDKNARSSFSNYGERVDVFAPGSGIQSASISSDTALTKSSGTSMASPQVAGIAACLISMAPSISLLTLNSIISSFGKQSVLTDMQGSTNLVARLPFNGLRIKSNNEWKSFLPFYKDSTWKPVGFLHKANGQYKKIFR